MDKQTKKQKYKRQKIDTYVSLTDINRLKLICKKYEFTSTYQLLQYLVDCFLRVADPSNDDNDKAVPYEIEEMFISPTEYRRIKKLANKKKHSKKFEIQLLIPYGEYLDKRTRKAIINEKGISLNKEIQHMFDENTEWENKHSSRGSHEGMYINKKQDQRKIKTPDDLK